MTKSLKEKLETCKLALLQHRRGRDYFMNDIEETNYGLEAKAAIAAMQSMGEPQSHPEVKCNGLSSPAKPRPVTTGDLTAVHTLRTPLSDFTI